MNPSVVDVTLPKSSDETVCDLYAEGAREFAETLTLTIRYKPRHHHICHPSG